MYCVSSNSKQLKSSRMIFSQNQRHKYWVEIYVEQKCFSVRWANRFKHGRIRGNNRWHKSTETLKRDRAQFQTCNVSQDEVIWVPVVGTRAFPWDRLEHRITDGPTWSYQTLSKPHRKKKLKSPSIICPINPKTWGHLTKKAKND